MSNEIIRTLALYQPFCSLMAHGKIETRWVRKGRKPPFPLGKYLFYSTKKPCTGQQLIDWCGDRIYDLTILKDDETSDLHGYALSIGDLVNVRLMTKEDEKKAFVKFIGERPIKDKKGNEIIQVQVCLEFEKVTRIVPFIYDHGKQGVGIFDPSKNPSIIYENPLIISGIKNIIHNS